LGGRKFFIKKRKGKKKEKGKRGPFRAKGGPTGPHTRLSTAQLFFFKIRNSERKRGKFEPTCVRISKIFDHVETTVNYKQT
jgi:hypothetical protein